MMQKFQFKSPNIRNGGYIPIEFTCDGSNISPILEWSNPPHGTRSFVIIVDDPDAIPVVGHVVTHFAVINIDPNLRRLGENQDFFEITPAMTLQNDHGSVGWMGPCPPKKDQPHSYYFTLYALSIPNIQITIKTKLTADIFENYFKQFILGQASFVGRYQRL
jgi:Raf kinase inhibitor-like YbhB/YbcL family protein